MVAGFGVHIQSHRGGHHRGGIDGLLGFSQPRIGAPVSSLLGLGKLLLFSLHLL
jgi:hypothetical protein